MDEKASTLHFLYNTSRLRPIYFRTAVKGNWDDEKTSTFGHFGWYIYTGILNCSITNKKSENSCVEVKITTDNQQIPEKTIGMRIQPIKKSSAVKKK